MVITRRRRRRRQAGKSEMSVVEALQTLLARACPGRGRGRGRTWVGFRWFRLDGRAMQATRGEDAGREEEWQAGQAGQAGQAAIQSYSGFGDIY